MFKIFNRKPRQELMPMDMPTSRPGTGRIDNGDLVRDSITGFEGIVTAKSEFLNKCVRLQVQPQALHEGKPIEPQVFDEEQLIVIKAAAAPTRKLVATGGDHKPPGRASIPSR